ncbi:MAG: FAD-binding protein [Desulfomonile sp.]|nr:FAD-binding protein [Desulfomonile sp.]
MHASIRRELIDIVGTDGATDRIEDLVAYSYDASPQEHLADIILFPASTKQVSAIMKVADREVIPVTARGSGTNLAGETVPLRGGIVMVLTRMDRILSIDPENLTATVEPGVINYDLQLAAAQVGLMYPPDPASWMVATMGGTVGTNAGGPRTVKYGVTRDYLLGLTVVLADGRVLKIGRGPLRHVAGYDLVHLICGSEGTLGIVTEITVRLIPRPAATRTLRADFDDLEDCGRAVAAIIREGIIPSALELMDQSIIGAVERANRLGLPLDVEGILLMEVDGDPESLDPITERISTVLSANRATKVIVARDAAEAEHIWKARRGAFSAMACLRPNAITEDATVPVTQLATMIRKVNEIAERHNVQIGVLAHAGDGNLHPLILFDQRDRDEVRRVEAASAEIFREALTLGGTLSGEHGIGIEKAQYLSLEFDEVAMGVTRAIKQALDPKGILNPGKFV